MAFNSIKTKTKTKKYIDKGDCWNCLYRDINDLDPIIKNFFVELYQKIQEYNKINGTNFVIFETRRNIERQKRLIKNGVSWIRNPKTAPHVEGRAFDIVLKKDNVYMWNANELKKLRNWIDINFKYASLLRIAIKKDYPHYEFDRKTFYKMKKEGIKWLS